MRDITNLLRGRLDKLERQRPDQSTTIQPDWDALARPGGWADFVASIGPPSPEAVELKRAHRERLAQACSEFGCTPADLGFLDDAAVERVRLGLPARPPIASIPLEGEPHVQAD